MLKVLCNPALPRTLRRTALFQALMVSLLVSPGAVAQTGFTLSRTTSLEALYTPGSTVDVTVRLNVTTGETLTAFGLEETVPTGWGFQGVVSGDPPDVLPNTGESGLLEFAWFPLPETFPREFTYRLSIPGDATGLQAVAGQGVARLLETGEIRTDEVITALPGEVDGPRHTADQNDNSILNLSELLRVIQFFNMGALRCQNEGQNTEDGYQPGIEGPTGCGHHDSDYNPADWVIDLSELLRTIQFFNAGGYFPCPEQNTEDGYCPLSF